VITPNLNVYPNPFRNEVNIRVQGLEKSAKTIDIFDIKGQKVRTFTSPGISNTLTWDGRNCNGDKVGSGIYFIRVHCGEKEIVRKVLFLK
jgi:flagellar hook assembly protein FlgD